MTEVSMEQVMNLDTPTELPAASLIICSRNRPQLLLEAIESILQGDEVPGELIIIDQSDALHPGLATLRTERRCEIRYTWTHSVGLSRANNLGIAAALHEVLVFTHDDVLVTSTWFGAIVRALVEAGPRSVVTGQVRPSSAQTPGGFAPSTKVARFPAVYEGRIGEDVLYPLNMAMYRFAISEVGGFDERLGPGTPFPGAEDNDYGFRLLEAGYRILYVPQAVVYHRAWRTAQDYVPLLWSYGLAQGGYYAKYLSLRDRYMLGRLTRSVKTHIFQSFRTVMSKRGKAYADALYALAVIYGATKWLVTQRTRR